MEIGDCVYILTGQVVNEYKIGKTNNIFNRLSTFRTASPEINIRHLCYTPNKDFVERNMHELFKVHMINQNHEWFRFENIEPTIRKLEIIASDYLSLEQELTYNEEIGKHWYRELKFIVKSLEEKTIIVGKYDFKTKNIISLDRKDMIVCFRFKLTYEELDNCYNINSFSEIENPLPEFSSLSFNKPDFKKSVRVPRSEPKLVSKKMGYNEIGITYYCKHILTKGKKKGDACGRIVTAKPINLCYSHANLKNVCRFQYSRGSKKDMMCAIKIRTGEYCTPHQYVIRKKEERRAAGVVETEDDEEEGEGEGEGEEEESELGTEPEFILLDGEGTFEDCEESTMEGISMSPNLIPQEEVINISDSVKTFKTVQENLMFLYKDLLNQGFIRPCSRCKTFYTKNYFIKKGRVCHFCKTDWF